MKTKKELELMLESNFEFVFELKFPLNNLSQRSNKGGELEAKKLI